MKSRAFTLAEIMITIGIVGVVAAITIPTLIQNSNSKKFSTLFKKELSTLNQAAISAQAQYDMDYGSITYDSDPSTCGSDKFSDSQSTMCALFNSTLSAKNYMGVYGEVNGSIFNSKYQFTKKTDGFDPTNFLLYTLADGSIVGFNPNAKRCSLESGQTINKSILTDENGLKNCIGFIDVNGVSLPNKEVTCADGTSSLDADNACTLKTTGSKVGDVYPIVFHNGTVEPATNAGFAQFGAGSIEDPLLRNLDPETKQSVLKMKDIYDKLSEVNDALNADNNGNWTTKCADFDDACFMNIFADKLNVQKTCNNPVSQGCQSISHFADGSISSSDTRINDPWPTIVLDDGTSIKFRFHGNGCEKNLSHYTNLSCGWLQIDTNGLDGSNTAGKDIFFLEITPDGVKNMGYTKGYDDDPNICNKFQLYCHNDYLYQYINNK